MKLFCRYCFKDQDIDVNVQNEQIMALCKECHELIKFMNRKEIIQLIKEEIILRGSARRSFNEPQRISSKTIRK